MNESPQVPLDLVKSYQNVAVLITGATGFIGRWVARWLSACDAQLYLVVRNRPLAESQKPIYRIDGQVIEWDARRPDRITQIVSDVRPSIVFNLAGYGVRRDERDEQLSRQINCTALTLLAEAQASNASVWDGQQLVHTGSALEYGPAPGDLDEVNTVPIPTTPYGIHKLAGTTALSQVCEQTGLRGMTARLFTVYGPGEPSGRLLPSLLAAAASAEPVPLTGGQQCRDFTYVDDVAEGLLRIGMCTDRLSNVLNLATGRLTTVREFTLTAAQVAGISQNRLAFGTLPTRSEEMQHDPLRIDRLQAATAWKPEISIEEGVTRTMHFQRTNVDIGTAGQAKP